MCASASVNALAGAAPKRVSILGVSGSIGGSTCKVIAHNPGVFEVEAITAMDNTEALIERARALKPKLAVIGNEARYAQVKEALAGSGIEVVAGEAALIAAAGRPCDIVVSAIVGAAGLKPTLEAIRKGRAVALANKESLVVAGSLMTAEAKKYGAALLPVDSEHSGIFQVLDAQRLHEVERITITASGGPFRTLGREAMKSVTPEQAVKHPNWSMGAKISVDSATLMNKGLELIEAQHLFDVPHEKLHAIVHPESIVHALVEYVDGSVLAQMAMPDMCTPIACALAWPKRISAPAKRLDLARLGQLTFEAPDESRFPALKLARQAMSAGGRAPVFLNAANEVAVAAFLAARIGFLDIVNVVEQTLQKADNAPLTTLEDIASADAGARALAESFIIDCHPRV